MSHLPPERYGALKNNMGCSVADAGRKTMSTTESSEKIEPRGLISRNAVSSFQIQTNLQNDSYRV